MKWLTKPTRGRVALWMALAFLWFLFLPQHFEYDPDLKHSSVLGWTIWGVVQVWLVSLAWVTFRDYRRERR